MSSFWYLTSTYEPSRETSQPINSTPSILWPPNAILLGGTSAALCYNLAEPPARDAWNPEYASRLRAVALKTGLPADYIASLDPK